MIGNQERPNVRCKSEVCLQNYKKKLYTQFATKVTEYRSASGAFFIVYLVLITRTGKVDVGVVYTCVPAHFDLKNVPFDIIFCMLKDKELLCQTQPIRINFAQNKKRKLEEQGDIFALILLSTKILLTSTFEFLPKVLLREVLKARQVLMKPAL